MGEQKGAILIVVVCLVIFGLCVGFATGVIQPLLNQIGSGMSNMVSNVFKSIPTAVK
ncbi:hypothetical protein [Bacillus thuringiensis]|uniref:hypothetical protein n=1 Tax=Bacillus thuringiensis TaxID=1428 RepID=UPI00286880F7|nr:hypothetical protein [Bacillus thuringiensis]